MHASNWWSQITTGELLELRRQLSDYLRSEFGAQIASDLEDVVQHAFVVMFQRRTELNPEAVERLRYLKTVARNAALDRLRARRRRQDHAPKVTRHRRQAAEPATHPAFPEETDRIWKIFAALDDVDRFIVWSHVIRGQSVRSLARELDLDWHRVAASLERSLRRFRLELRTWNRDAKP